MFIKPLKYAARQISKHFEMLNKEDYRNARADNFLKWYEGVREKISKGEITTKPNNILYSATVDPLPAKETLPDGFRFYFSEEWSYASAKMDYRITILKTIKQINWDKLTLENISGSYKPFRADITADIINKQKHFNRKIRKSLKPYVANTIIVTNKTTYEDILMQLIILALQDKFIEIDRATIAIFRSYINKKIHLNNCTKQLIKDLLYPQKGVQSNSLLSVETILYHLVRNYIRPYNAYTFKFYLREIIQGLHKEEKRKDAIIIPRGLKPIQSESHFQNNLTENFNRFQIFYDEHGEEIGIGVDRAAIEFGISRDKIYRLIKKGKLKIVKIEGICVLDKIAQENLLKIWREKKIYLDRILSLSLKRKIKINSARKIIKREQRKKLIVKSIPEAVHKNCNA